jgi:hypothetical protein
MSPSLQGRARRLAYSWFRTVFLTASHQAAWRFCRRHWPAFLEQARQQRLRAAVPEDAPVRLVRRDPGRGDGGRRGKRA